jgi:purine-binding chemotaxis protein CheW
MLQDKRMLPAEGNVELVTFRVGDALCGMNILRVQEINKQLEITTVPHAPDYVQGIMNLRGQIVTIIDLGRKLGLGRTRMDGRTRNIIVDSGGEYIGLLVSDISNVIAAHRDEVAPSPANIGDIQGSFFTGVLKTSDRLIGVLDLEKVMSEETR